MASNIVNPYGDPTNEELLAFTRAALSHVTMHGWYRGMDGEIVQHATIKELRQQIKDLQAEIAAESATPGQKTNYARRNRPA